MPAQTKQIAVREFEVTKDFTGRQVLADKNLRATGMDNKEANTILQSDSLRREYLNKGLFPCWVPGTVVAYPKRGDELTETIFYDGITYKVPEEVLKEHGGKQNTLLVLQRDFDMDSEMVINGKVAKVLTLPSGDGWRMPDADNGIPQGEEVSASNPEAHYGWFRDDSAYIGPLVGGCGGVFYDWRDVGAGRGLDGGFGVGGLSQVQAKQPQQVKQAVAEAPSWLLELQRTADLCGPVVAKLEQVVQPDLLAPFKELIRKAKATEIKE